MGLSFSPRLITCCKYFLICLNILFIFIGLLVIGLGIYLLIYKGDLLSVIFQMPHIKASCIILVFCGSFVLVMAIFGLCSVITLNKHLLLTYVILMLLVALLAIAAAIIAMVFRNTWYIDELRLKMRDVLQQKYGTNSTNSLFLTRTWDTVQQFWYCCGVEDNSWGIYRQSEWYNDQPGDPGTKEYTAKMVPESCCVKNQYGNFINLQKCQNWQLGPPNKQSGLDTNEAVFYKGCFTIGRGILEDVGNGVIGLGIALGVIMILGVLAAFALYCGVRNTSDKRMPASKPSSSYYMPQQRKQDLSTDRGQASRSPVEMQPLDGSGSWRRDDSQLTENA